MLYSINFNNSFDELFGNFFNFDTPKARKNAAVEKTEKEFILTTELPGFKKEDVKISTENNILKITAKRNRLIKQEEYEKSYSLEDSIDIEKITAKLEDGILTIKLPFKEKAKPNVITIQ